MKVFVNASPVGVQPGPSLQSAMAEQSFKQETVKVKDRPLYLLVARVSEVECQVLWRLGSPAAQVLSKIQLLIQPPCLSARQHLCLCVGGAPQPLLHPCWFSATSHSCSPLLPTSGSLCQPCPCSPLPQDPCVTKSPGSLTLLANVNCWSKCSGGATVQCASE